MVLGGRKTIFQETKKTKNGSFYSGVNGNINLFTIDLLIKMNIKITHNNLWVRFDPGSLVLYYQNIFYDLWSRFRFIYTSFLWKTTTGREMKKLTWSQCYGVKESQMSEIVSKNKWFYRDSQIALCLILRVQYQDSVQQW